MHKFGWTWLLPALFVCGCGGEAPLYQGRTVAQWIERLDTNEPKPFAEAVDALVHMGEGAVDELSAALYVEDRDVRTGAALALLRINDRGRQKVVHVLQTGGTFTRLSMANAMITENYKPELTIPILAEELMDPDDWLVRNQASKALSQLSPKSVSAVPALVELLRHPEAEVRRRAAFAMVRIGPGAKAATPALVEALKDQDPRVREGAAYALGTIGPDASPSAPALEVASQDADPKVRYRAAQALKLVTAQRS